jgi:hypothetical protein
MEWVEMGSKTDLKTAEYTRPAHQTGVKSWILWVEVPMLLRDSWQGFTDWFEQRP